MRLLASTSIAALGIGFASAPPITAPTTAPATEKKARKPQGPRVAPTLTDVVTLDLPVREVKRGSTSLYPFDKLEVGQSFGVKDKDARQLSSVVSNQNRKHRSELKDEAGKVTQTIQAKRFVAIDVDAEIKAKIKGTALEGSKAIIQRVQP